MTRKPQDLIEQHPDVESHVRDVPILPRHVPPDADRLIAGREYYQDHSAVDNRQTGGVGHTVANAFTANDLPADSAGHIVDVSTGPQFQAAVSTALGERQVDTERHTLGVTARTRA